MKSCLFAVYGLVLVIVGGSTLTEGAEWGHFGLPGMTVNSIAIDPTDPRTVFAGAEEGLFRTTDEGATWDTLAPGLLYGITAVAIDLSNPQLVHAVHGMGDGNDGVYRSTDGGDTWHLIYGLAYGTSFFARSSRLYVGALDDSAGGGVHLSTDGGATWNTANQGLTNLDVLSLGGTDCIGDSLDVDLTGTRDGVFRRPIYDTLWTWAGPSSGAFMFDFAGGSLNSDLYSAFGGGSWSDGVYKSTDMGQSWEVRYWIIYCEAVAVNPLNHLTVYGGSNGYGVIRSTDAGQNWQEMNQGLADLDIKDLAFCATDTAWLYAGTVGGGIFRYGVAVGREEGQEARGRPATALRTRMQEARLLQNYPNPFGAGGTTIQFKVQNANCKISLKVYDLGGSLVKVLVDEALPTCPVECVGYSTGTPYFLLPTSVVWDGRDESGRRLPGGIYFYTLTVGESATTKKMEFVR